MSFNIGSAIMGAVQGFLETGNPAAAGVMGAVDGFTGSSSSGGSILGSLGQDSMLLGGQDPSSLMSFAQLAEAAG